MEIWSKKEEKYGNNKKEENGLQTALSPAVAGHIFDEGAMRKLREKFELFANNQK